MFKQQCPNQTLGATATSEESDISEQEQEGSVQAKQRTNHIQFRPETMLSQIAMLGSHDAGTFAYSKKVATKYNKELQSNNKPSQSKGWKGNCLTSMYKCQNQNLVQQAQAGARYFDIRVTKDKGENKNKYRFFHGNGIQSSMTSGDACADVKTLLAHARKDKNNIYIYIEIRF